MAAESSTGSVSLPSSSSSSGVESLSSSCFLAFFLKRTIFFFGLGVRRTMTSFTLGFRSLLAFPLVRLERATLQTPNKTVDQCQYPFLFPPTIRINAQAEVRRRCPPYW
jgi:hypothetical protein